MLQTDLENKKNSAEWKAYEKLIRERPWEFEQNEALTIVTDLEEIVKFEKEKGRTIGVVYQSPYNIMAVDLVRNRQGNVFAYERLLPAVAKGAVVGIPVFDGKFVLLRQYRHALRDFQYAFPRGFAEAGMEAEENVKKEISEEIGADVHSAEFLGNVVADSGISGNRVSVYACRIGQVELKKNYEGIEKLEILPEEILRKWFAEGKITDAYTLAAYSLLESRK